MMAKKKRLFPAGPQPVFHRLPPCLFLVFLAFLVFFPGPVAASGRAGEKPIVLRFSSFIPPSHPADKLLKDFCHQLEKAGDGRVKLEYYGTGSLGAAREQYEIATEGLADIATTCCGYTGCRFPLALGIQLPFFAESAATGSRIILELMKEGFFREEFADVVYLFPLATTPCRIFSNRKITRVEDFKGLRIFGGESVFIDVCEALGAVPITISTPDVYMALQRHTVDAGLAPWTPGIAAWKWQEVTRWVIDVPLLSGWHCNVVMHRESWNRVPADIQRKWRPLFPIYARKFAVLYDTLDKVMRKRYENYRGGEIITFSEAELHRLAEKMIPVWGKWVRENGDQGRRMYLAYVAIMKKLHHKVWVQLPGLYPGK